MSLTRKLVFLAAALFVGLTGEIGPYFYRDHPLPLVVVDVLVGWVYWLAGYLAWTRRPASLIGPLLVLGGIFWAVGGYRSLPWPEVATVAYLFTGGQSWVVVWVASATPAGGSSAASRG